MRRKKTHRNQSRFKPTSQRKRYPVKWSNQTCAMIGFWSGRGMTSDAIADKAKVEAGDIRKMCSFWGLPKCVDEHGDVAPVIVYLGKSVRGEISRQAAKRGIEVDELLRRMFTNTKRDNLWKAVLDD